MCRRELGKSLLVLVSLKIRIEKINRQSLENHVRANTLFYFFFFDSKDFVPQQLGRRGLVGYLLVLAGIA